MPQHRLFTFSELNCLDAYVFLITSYSEEEITNFFNHHPSPIMWIHLGLSYNALTPTEQKAFKEGYSDPLRANSYVGNTTAAFPLSREENRTRADVFTPNLSNEAQVQNHPLDNSKIISDYLHRRANSSHNSVKMFRWQRSSLYTCRTPMVAFRRCCG